MIARPLVFTHLHKCAGSSLRRMLHAKLQPLVPVERMHIPTVTCGEMDNLPMMEERGETLPCQLLVLADHSPCGLYDARVLAAGRPFKIILLREPIDRLESFYHFCLRAGYLPPELAVYDDLQTMPSSIWREICRFFVEISDYVRWLAPHRRERQAAIDALLRYDVIARHDDFEGFCRRFNEHNPYGIRFAVDDILHDNRTPRPSPLSQDQRAIAEEELVEDLAIWKNAAVQRALRPTLPAPRHASVPCADAGSR